MAPPPDVELDTGPTTSTYALVISVAILAVVVIAVIAAVAIRRPRGMADSGFEERPLDADSVVDAFGPCAAREVELAEAEGGLRAVVVQRDTAKQRALDLEDEASRTTFEHLRARAELEDAVQRREARTAAGRIEPLPEFRREDLGLATEQGQVALATFVRDEITADELEARWLELGEHDAIEYTRLVGVARASGGRVSVAELRAAQREQHARAAADAAEADLDHAQLEIERLAEREQLAMARIVEARERLAACRDGRPLPPAPPSSPGAPVDRATPAGDRPDVPSSDPTGSDDPAAPADPVDLGVAGSVDDAPTADRAGTSPADAAPADGPTASVAPSMSPPTSPATSPATGDAASADAPTADVAADVTIDVREPDAELTPLVLVQRAREAARARAVRTGELPAVTAGSTPGASPMPVPGAAGPVTPLVPPSASAAATTPGAWRSPSWPTTAPPTDGPPASTDSETGDAVIDHEAEPPPPLGFL